MSRYDMKSSQFSLLLVFVYFRGGQGPNVFPLYEKINAFFFSEVEGVAVQQVVTLDNNQEILGMQATPSFVYVITSQSLYTIRVNWANFAMTTTFSMIRCIAAAFFLYVMTFGPVFELSYSIVFNDKSWIKVFNV